MSGEAITPLPSNRGVTDPRLKDLLDLFRKDVFLSLNCHHIATIQSFNADSQTVTATINYKKSYEQRNAVTGVYEQVLVDYPILVDCPAVILHGGSARMTFPIAQGDQCLILFNDRDMDNWFSSGQVAQLNSQRLHSISDGIALVGLYAKNALIEGYDQDHALLEWEGGGRVGVSEDKVLIENATRNLNTVLQNILTHLQTLVTQTAAISVASFGTPPSNAAAITAVGTQLATDATQLGELLE